MSTPRNVMPLGLTVANLPRAVRLRRERIDSILVGQEQFAVTEATVTDPLDGENRGLTAIRATAASQRWRSGRAQQNQTSRPMGRRRGSSRLAASARRTWPASMLLFTGWRVLAARRSETVKGLLDGRDERITSIDLKATAFAGGVVLITIIGAFVVEIARGQDGLPYSWLGALGGVSYIGAVVALRFRSQT
jgi:hypothetical protein